MHGSIRSLRRGCSQRGAIGRVLHPCLLHGLHGHVLVAGTRLLAARMIATRMPIGILVVVSMCVSILPPRILRRGGLQLSIVARCGVGDDTCGSRLPLCTPAQVSGQQHILGLQVRVYHAMLSVQVVKCDEELACNVAHDFQRYSVVVVTLDEREQVVTERLEDHAHMQSIRPAHVERVKQSHDILVAFRVAACNLPQDGHFVTCSLGVVFGALLHLERAERVGFVRRSNEPHCGKVPPPELLEHAVACAAFTWPVHVVHPDVVVSPSSVPFYALVFTWLG
mmetsp:Transcript_861/g.2098  ORF Transcript_861/g.2098 Transcript_861/m.2098 type:complete len:281 (-) Transcript_861:557-1399(-)